MKQHLIVISIVMSQTMVAVADDEPKQIWHQNYDDAYREAKAANLPILLHFYADWCGPCRQMEQGVLNSPDVMRQLGRVVVGAKIDVDHQPETAARYAVEDYPFDLVVSPDGKVLHRSSGYAKPVHYVKRIRTAAAGFDSKVETPIQRRPPQSAARFGLRGYSPVAITCDRQWQRGRPEFSASHDNVEYWLRNDEELQLFRRDPLSYVPQLGGYDPVIAKSESRWVRGSMNIGGFYRNQLYLFTSDKNRKRFTAAPKDFVEEERFDLVDLRQVEP